MAHAGTSLPGAVGLPPVHRRTGHGDGLSSRWHLRVLNREPWIAEHQIRIWYPQPLSLPCSVNDAVNLLPCSTCAYLYGRLSWAALPFQDDAGFRPPPDYGSGGQAACWPMPHIAVPFRLDMGAVVYSSGVLVPAVQRGRCCSVRMPAAVAGVHSAEAYGLPVAGTPRPVSARPDSRYRPRLRRPT
jgi:hypothetical protein